MANAEALISTNAREEDLKTAEGEWLESLKNTSCHKGSNP